MVFVPPVVHAQRDIRFKLRNKTGKESDGPRARIARSCHGPTQGAVPSPATASPRQLLANCVPGCVSFTARRQMQQTSSGKFRTSTPGMQDTCRFHRVIGETDRSWVRHSWFGRQETQLFRGQGPTPRTRQSSLYHLILMGSRRYWAIFRLITRRKDVNT